MLRKEGNPAQVSIPVGTSLDEAEKILIERTLEHTKDNKAKAARMLGVSRKTLYDKLKSVD
jgi:DNA-binding NtrC family response regulator